MSLKDVYPEILRHTYIHTDMDTHTLTLYMWEVKNNVVNK